MNKLYEALEVCLNEIEKGADVDTVLFRYPELADELRPILETSVKAKAMAAPGPSQEVLRRNRAKVLQRASELRELKAASASRRIWSVPLRRALVTFMVVAMLFVSGTGLVRASSSTLPGDNLYPVKRTWESLSLLLTLDAGKREALEFEHENERLEELHELFAEGRSVKVDFAGYVTRLSVDEWRVSGITVFISSETRLPAQQIAVGDAVRVKGHVESGSILAEQIELLPPDSKLPEVEDDGLEFGEEGNEESKPQVDQNSGPGSVVEPTAKPKVPNFTPEFDPQDVTVEGVVTSVKNNLIVINGIVMDIQSARIKGTPSVGITAKAEGYYGSGGVFIVIKIEFKNTGSINENESSNDINSNDENSNVDNTNDENDNDNDNDNGDNSGSGGGGDD